MLAATTDAAGAGAGRGGMVSRARCPRFILGTRTLAERKSCFCSYPHLTYESYFVFGDRIRDMISLHLEIPLCGFSKMFGLQRFRVRIGLLLVTCWRSPFKRSVSSWESRPEKHGGHPVPRLLGASPEASVDISPTQMWGGADLMGWSRDSEGAEPRPPPLPPAPSAISPTIWSTSFWSIFCSDFSKLLPNNP